MNCDIGKTRGSKIMYLHVHWKIKEICRNQNCATSLIKNTLMLQSDQVRGSQIDWTIHRRWWGRRPPNMIGRLTTDRRPTAEPTAD